MNAQGEDTGLLSKAYEKTKKKNKKKIKNLAAWPKSLNLIKSFV